MASNALASATASLMESWCALFPEVSAPSTRQWAIWLTLHPEGRIRTALAMLTVRYEKSPGEFASPESLHRFGSAIMNRLAGKTVARK